ncbi:MAG: efflux RND transporter periplasmic adaptor subunit [Candidatus Aminicenantes bacterium]|nr:efflux RND transporter periplasmic adaptor subunit [Candidatus Aminicenantes bacterium]
MKKVLFCLTLISLVVCMGCAKSRNSEISESRDQENRSQRRTDGPLQSKRERSNPQGKMPADLKDIDIDKLNIPDQMKEAIRSGRIPKERVQEMLRSMQGEGGDLPLVSVQNLERKNLNSYLILNGVVEPERTIEIFSRLSAYVKKIVKEEGDYVQENDILALLDDTEITIGYKQSKIELEQAKLSYEEEKRNYERNKELIKKMLISEQEFQASEALTNQREMDYERSLENFKNYELQLNWTKIRSLSSGYITERLIEMGDKVNSNEHVYTIEDFSPLLIRVYAPSADAIHLKPQMETEITTDVLEGKVFEGNVKLINPRIDVQSGTVKVTVETYDESRQLLPGMFVQVKIIVGQKEDILVVPRKALLFKQNKSYVFVLNGRNVEEREVNLGLTEEDEVEIVEGLKEGEVIVVVGVESLKDGQMVEIIQ